MAASHSELMKELLPLYHQEPTRFMRFYNLVYIKIISIPEGGVLRIANYCSKEAIGLFIKIASLLIIEETCRKEVTDDLLEFSDDYTIIRRIYKFVPSRPYRKGVKSI